ncbi:hypothetical protein EGW08_016349, partial [Elysia chlorotica]
AKERQRCDGNSTGDHENFNQSSIVTERTTRTTTTTTTTTTATTTTTTNKPWQHTTTHRNKSFQCGEKGEICCENIRRVVPPSPQNDHYVGVILGANCSAVENDGIDLILVGNVTLHRLVYTEDSHGCVTMYHVLLIVVTSALQSDDLSCCWGLSQNFSRCSNSFPLESHTDGSFTKLVGTGKTSCELWTKAASQTRPNEDLNGRVLVCRRPTPRPAALNSSSLRAINAISGIVLVASVALVCIGMVVVLAAMPVGSKFWIHRKKVRGKRHLPRHLVRKKLPKPPKIYKLAQESEKNMGGKGDSEIRGTGKMSQSKSYITSKGTRFIPRKGTSFISGKGTMGIFIKRNLRIFDKDTMGMESISEREEEDYSSYPASMMRLQPFGEVVSRESSNASASFAGSSSNLY